MVQIFFNVGWEWGCLFLFGFFVGGGCLFKKYIVFIFIYLFFVHPHLRIFSH